ncbi:hypothetical protein XHV734_3995 [Xanthomonas hortorum pv. vitians]|nr:hypothetical protein XHV734_3995 [Xanthomonas hortorum pv. vitians]
MLRHRDKRRDMRPLRSGQVSCHGKPLMCGVLQSLGHLQKTR